MPDYSHCIVAGVNKCGTTSLYRYLTDHPEVCGSAVKETHFFFDYVTSDSDLSYENYRRNFDRFNSNCRVMVEASPGYFTSGAGVAKRIASVLPDVKLIIMLREPIDRLYSYFRSAQVYDNYARDMLSPYSFDRFVREALDLAAGSGARDKQEIEFVRAIGQGSYASHAKKLHDVFRDSQIMYVFFEDFCQSPGNWMKDVSRFLGIREDFYDDYGFTVENRTRTYRNSALHRLAFRINMGGERFLNRHRTVRHALRSIYLRINEHRGKSDEPIGPRTRSLLNRFYGRENIQLREFLLQRYPSITLPAWLR